MRVLRHAPPASDLALAIGSFDGVHRGHQAVMGRVVEAARQRGLTPAVLTFDPLPREFFEPERAPARISSLAERIDAIAKTGIEIVFVQRFDRAFAAITAEQFHERLRQRYRVRWVAIGDNFHYGAGRRGDARLLAAAGSAQGFDVEVVRPVTDDGDRVSSTRVREALAAGDLARAARLLGRPYAICGRVLHGAKRGRTLGFPTANIRLARPRPALGGIFAVKCFGAATRGLEGVASLGINPAVQDGGPATLEAFLFDFSGDLYGRRLTIEFLKKLRDEAHFASLDQLARQIAADCDAARAHFRAMGTDAERHEG
jgi:riboflavin kinase/FMN adenylyltransferase